MFNLTTNTDSYWTGRLIYSDVQLDPFDGVVHAPVLNRLGYVPGLSLLSGALRCAAAVLHIFAHAFAALFSDKGHWAHVAKGFAEITRGIVEMVPIVGNVACALFDNLERTSSDLDSDDKRRVWIVRIDDPYLF